MAAEQPAAAAEDEWHPVEYDGLMYRHEGPAWTCQKNKCRELVRSLKRATREAGARDKQQQVDHR